MEKQKMSLGSLLLLITGIIVGVAVILGLGLGLIIRDVDEENRHDYVWAPEGTTSDPDPDSQTVEHEPKQPVSDDDGELHDGWNADCGYSRTDMQFSKNGTMRVDAYDMNAKVEFSVGYPVFKNAGEYTDALNEAIEACALDTVNSYYENPDEKAVELVKTVVENGALGVPEGVDLLLTSDVSYAVTYNTPDFVSISFSDNYCLGSLMGEFISLRCINANLRTGQIYRQDEVFKMTEDIANAFVDNLVQAAGSDENGDGVITEEECFSVDIIGHEAWVQALMGEGEYASRMNTTFFVDEKGRPNLGVTYFLGNDRGVSRGWWDVTLTDELLDGARLESDFWDLLQ